MRKLRVAVVLFLVAASSGCGGDDEPCDDVHEVMTRISEPPPAEYATEIADCQAYFKKCLVVCDHVLRDMQIEVDASAVIGCMVKHDATGHDVTVDYSDGTCDSAASP